MYELFDKYEIDKLKAQVHSLIIQIIRKCVAIRLIWFLSFISDGWIETRFIAIISPYSVAKCSTILKWIKIDYYWIEICVKWLQIIKKTFSLQVLLGRIDLHFFLIFSAFLLIQVILLTKELRFYNWELFRIFFQ